MFDLSGYFTALKNAYPQRPPAQAGGIPSNGMITIIHQAQYVSVIPIQGHFVRVPNEFVEDNAAGLLRAPHFAIASAGQAPVWRGQDVSTGEFRMGPIGGNSVVLDFPALASSQVYSLVITDPVSGARTMFSLTLEGAFLTGINADGTERCVATYGPR